MNRVKSIFIGIFIITSSQILADEKVFDADRLYRDSDAAALASRAGPGNKGQWRHKLNVAIMNNPNDAFALSQRAYMRSIAGDLAGSEKDYLRALESADKKTVTYRHVLWSLGWAKFNMGDDKSAIDYWGQAEQHHGGSPYWLPYTVSLAYWRLGEKELALVYYAMAVNSDLAWGLPDKVLQKTHHWKDGEKKVHGELFAEYLKRAEIARQSGE